MKSIEQQRIAKIAEIAKSDNRRLLCAGGLVNKMIRPERSEAEI
jgi:hypothetical protein